MSPKLKRHDGPRGRRAGGLAAAVGGGGSVEHHHQHPDMLAESRETNWMHTTLDVEDSVYEDYSDLDYDELGRGKGKRASGVVKRSLDLEDSLNLEEKFRVAQDWLKDNFYDHPTGSVSRSWLFEQYCSMCYETGNLPMNMATLGKQIRTLFPGIITRRLGNRGNSKYHYYGLQAVGVPLPPAEPADAPPAVPKKRSSRVSKREMQSQAAAVMENTDAAPAEPSAYRPIVSRSLMENRAAIDSLLCSQHSLPPFQSPFVEAASPDYSEFVRLLHQICTFAVSDPVDLASEAFRRFSLGYQQHTVGLLQKIVERDFLGVERALTGYWCGLAGDELAMVNSEEGVRLVSVADDYLYQVAMNLLIPNATEPFALSALQAIRTFAKSVEGWFGTVSLETGVPIIFGTAPVSPQLVDAKVDLARRFSMILRRRTSVNHLAQAFSSVLLNHPQVSQMLHDWDHVDFAAIRDQIKWIVGVKEPFVSYIEVSVKSYLMEEAGVCLWTHWLENLIEQFIAVEMTSGKTLDKAAKSLILGWSFYLTMILRDLTLRSASSFGSFHILRLFLEEYVMFYIEKKLDEHRRAVGMLAYWPGQELDSLASVSPSSYAQQQQQQQPIDNLHCLSSVADKMCASEPEVFDETRYNELTSYLS